MQRRSVGRRRHHHGPLAPFFTEDAAAGAARIAITYPVSSAAPAQRFLLEAYPLAGMVDATLVQWLYLHGEHGLHQQVDGVPGSVNITRGRSRERWEVAPAVRDYVGAQIAANDWLPDEELQIYVEEYGRTGFQGGLNLYRSGGLGAVEQQLFAGRTIDQPSLYIAGASDWGSYQSPGALERMQNEACTDMRGVHMVDGAGHWVQQEQPEETTRLLIEFLRGVP